MLLREEAHNKNFIKEVPAVTNNYLFESLDAGATGEYSEKDIMEALKTHST
eukprot:GABW01000541.1.p1 GENE.GABW01000541.1~~GABW01000541.1.p1  ORF type:complete len:51 (-),score=3.76 GABW01000541.1:3-155(-)